MSKSALHDLANINTLRKAWEKGLSSNLKRNTAGSDAITPQEFQSNLEKNLLLIREKILTKKFLFSPLRAIAIPKMLANEYRLVCIPTISDRIVQRALLDIIMSQSGKLGIDNNVSHGFVPHSHKGVRSAIEAACSLRNKKPWAFKADISKFFDNINREDLSKNLRRKFSLRSLYPLIDDAISSEIDSKTSYLVRETVKKNNIIVGKGIRQGMPISPLMSNIVLSEFDQKFSEKYDIIRYADDLIVFGETEDICKQARTDIQNYLAKIGHTLNEKKSFIRPPGERIEFLGLELSLHNKKYSIKISKEQFSQINNSFKKLHDVDKMYAEQMYLSTFLQRMKNMRSGYLSAYSCASNSNLLETKLQNYTQRACEKVFSTMFGRSSMQKLQKNHKKFLEIL